MNATEILAKLVSFPVLGGQNNLDIVNWIKTYVESMGHKPHMVFNEEGTKASLHCRIGPSVDGGTILSGHMDVVPVAGQEWDTDPFVLTDKGDGKLYARGSCDMKGYLACCLAVLPQMDPKTLKTPIYLAFSYDEEIGCRSAPELIEDIQRTYPEKAKFAIIGEPSLMQPIVGQKGISVLRTRINGSAGHSSRIKEEVSAVHEGARLVQWIEAKMDALIQAGHLDERFNPPHTTLHVGQFQGGIAANVVANRAELHWDIRTIPQDDLHAIIEEFHAFCAKQEEKLRKRFPNFKIETVEEHPPVPHLDTRATDEVATLIQELSGNTKLQTVSYAAEAGQFARAGYQSVICGPGSIQQAHRANEFITKEQLEMGVAMIQKLVAKMSE